MTESRETQVSDCGLQVSSVARYLKEGKIFSKKKSNSTNIVCICKKIPLLMNIIEKITSHNVNINADIHFWNELPWLSIW